ncbi:subtilisin-like protein, partial [Daedalea quercina L-15889]
TFVQTYRSDIPASTAFTLETLDGAANNQTAVDAGIEASLDIQYNVSVAMHVPTVFVSASEDTHDGALGGFLDMADLLLGQASPPQVFTTSYGPNPPLPSPLPPCNLCNAYAQLGARGLSVFFASGDGGVSGTQTSERTTFVVPFPRRLPVAASFSAGGFSNYWARPAYPAPAVAVYLAALGGMYAGFYNASGRGAFPDVTVQGINFSVVIDQEFYLVDGTSCSSPAFASAVVLLNDELLSTGRPILGFLNPWLYGVAAV